MSDMIYSIEVEYSTGDSETTFETSDELGISWQNLDVAKAALQRIKQRYQAYLKERWGGRMGYADAPDPKDCDGYDAANPYSIKLPLDDGTEQLHAMFWQSEFDHLKSARIKMSRADEDELSFTI